MYIGLIFAFKDSEVFMKQIFLLIIFTLFTLNSFAQIGEPVQITNPDDPVKFAGQNGFRVIGDNIYVTYLQNDNVIFAFSDNNGLDFEETEIDACYTNVLDRDTEPILEVLSDGTVIIIYLSKEIEDQVAYNYLKKAVGNTAGEFEIEIIEFNVFEKPTMTNSEDVITLFYKIGSSRSLSEYVYFSLSEESENADYSQESATVKFWGPDILDGPVHSNTDIWIQQGGGGNNEGFPTFNGFVTTSGIFRNYNQGGAPLSDAVKEIMFLGEPYPGYEELATPVEFSETAEDAHMNGIHIGEDADILYVKLEGQNYVSKVANIEFTGLEEFEVYSWFPTDAGLADAIVGMGGNWFEDSDNIWTNHIAIYDTVWSDGPSGVISGNSYFVDCELWIEGVVEGATTFACSDTVFIVGDITYENTIVGEDPDDPDNMNLSDYFGLISEEKILIRYKHRDPFEEMRIRDDNCDDINIYGAYAAIGKGNFEMYGDANCHHEGIITFQYHHPHGSTPDYRAMSPYNGQDTLYSYIDFHKFIFPAHPYVQPEYSGFKLHSNNPDMSGLICGYPIESQGFPDPYGYNSSYPNNTPYTNPGNHFSTE